MNKKKQQSMIYAIHTAFRRKKKPTKSMDVILTKLESSLKKKKEKYYLPTLHSVPTPEI